MEVPFYKVAIYSPELLVALACQCLQFLHHCLLTLVLLRILVPLEYQVVPAASTHKSCDYLYIMTHQVM